MLPTILTLLVTLTVPGGPTPDQKDALQKAGADVARLLELARAWSSAGQEDGAASAFQRVLDLDAKNVDAHEGLRHHLYDGKWFETYTALSKYRRAEDDRMLKEKGLVRFGDRWVEPDARDWLQFGVTQDASGAWVNPTTAHRVARERELVAQGCEQQDLAWIPPAEFEAWRKGLWKCGEQWLDQAGADAYHASIATPWVAPSEHFVVVSTLPRADVEWVKFWADATFADLVRVFGVAPGERPTPLDLRGPRRDKPTLACFRSIAQYNDFAAGNPAERRAVTELEGFSSVHYAFFAEAYFDAAAEPPCHRGSGVAFWEKTDPALAPFGQHSIRHAAAQSFVEAIDPSWRALMDAATNGLQPQSFWGEKQIPRWLRYGAASYVERWFVDANVGQGGDPKWSRTWALANLKEKGGLEPLDKVFAFALSLDDVAGSARAIHEAGLLVAFVLDGGDAKVGAAHQAFKDALKRGRGVKEAATALEKELARARPAIERFAGL